MATTPDASNSGPGGASRVAGRPARRKWLLPLLLGLLVLIALLLLLSQCGDDDPADPTAGTAASPAATPTQADTAPSATASTPASGPAGTGPTGAGQAGAPGTVIAGGDNLLGAGAAANLAGNDGQQAVGRAARVQSVPADEGFWVGTSEQDRLWVQLSGTRGESDYKVKEGDAIDFTGTVTRAAAGFAAQAGVTAAEGADQLTTQGHYVSVPASTVQLSR